MAANSTNANDHGFGTSLGFGSSPALVVVDMCKAYFTADSPLDLGESRVPELCADLVAAARASGIPVIWTSVRFTAEQAAGSLFYRKVPALSVFDEASELGEFLPGLEPHQDETVMVKQTASAFIGTDLLAHVTGGGIDSLFLCGVSTSGCVRATATDALQHDIIPIVVSDACGDRNSQTHNQNLFDLGAKYADIRTTAEVVAHMQDR